jgi:hypothetical protein
LPASLVLPSKAPGLRLKLRANPAAGDDTERRAKPFRHRGDAADEDSGRADRRA